MSTNIKVLVIPNKKKKASDYNFKTQKIWNVKPYLLYKIYTNLYMCVISKYLSWACWYI